MINTILSALTVRDIRRKVGFTALMLGLYRLGAHLYVPGVNVAAVKSSSALSGSGIFSFLNLFSGGALSQMAIFALGIMPYITASIILQLLVGIGGIKSENERKSSPKSSSTLHYKLPITHRESISRRFAASPPLCGVSAEFSPRMKENQSSNRAQLCTTNCRYLYRESVSPRFAASPPLSRISAESSLRMKENQALGEGTLWSPSAPPRHQAKKTARKGEGAPRT